MGEAVRHTAAHVHDLYLTPEAADRHADILSGFLICPQIRWAY